MYNNSITVENSIYINNK